MRILITGQTFNHAVNGQAIFTVNLAEGLARHNHDVLVLAPSEQGSAYHTQYHRFQISAVWSVQLNFVHPDVFYTPFPGKAVRNIFDAFRPDVVHINDHYPLSRAVLRIAQRYKVKAVGTNHFMPENLAPYIPGVSKFKPGFDRMLWQWMLEVFNRLDVATAPSKTAASILLQQGLQIPVYPISCGVDLERFRPDPSLDRRTYRKRFGLDPERVLFLFVGRVDGEKRLDVLLRALHQMERDDVQLAVAGKGAVRDELETLAGKLNLGSRVRFTGFVRGEELPALLNCADIFVMPSEAELLSIATLEAMACGRPVLAARARALPELVADGVNGYLFRPGDATDAAGYMAFLADHPERWPGMGTASLEKAQSHSLDNTLHSYEMIYGALLAKAKIAHPQVGLRSGRLVKRRFEHTANPLD
jgi:1,2-diacylglycerol 3-alpha-glucosyltransferase